MKSSFMKHVNDLIVKSDLVLEVLDARRPTQTRNAALERTVRGKRKRLLLVLNKADLLTKEEAEQKKSEIRADSHTKTIFVSALERDGINLIRREMTTTAKETGKKDFTVGVIGYPNVGKSTLINALAGRGKGRVATSRKAGLTRGIQKVKISDGLYLIDGPGIIPMEEKDEFGLYLVESKNPNQLKDLESAAVRLIQELGKEKVIAFYKLNPEEMADKDEEDLLEEIAKKQNLRMSGGKGDTTRAAREILEAYQKHELK